MEIKQIILMLRRWYWLLIAGFLAGTISGILVSFLMTPVYQFETKVLVSRNRQSATAEFPNLNDLQLVETYVELMLSDQILETVEKNTGYRIDTGKLTVQQLRDTQIIQIAVEDENIERGVMIANGLVNALQEENNRLQAQQYLTAENSLEEQITQAKVEMETLQNEIEKISTEDIQAQLDQVNGQIAALEVEIYDLQTEIAQMENSTAIVVQGRLAESQARLTSLQTLLNRYQGIRTNLIFFGKPDVAGGGISNPRLEQLNSTLDLYENIYLSHLTSLENLRLARLQSTPTVTQIEMAAIPEKPVRPIPIIYTGLAAIVGIVIAAAGIVTIEFFDDSIKTPEDLLAIKEVPVMGIIRKVSALDTHFLNEKEIAEPPLASVFEDYRSLGVQLQYQRERKRFSTLLVTSVGKGEGKTTAAVNLATIYARSGQSVLLIDAHLNRPRLHKAIKDGSEIKVVDLSSFKNEQGVSNDLLGMRKILSLLEKIKEAGNRLVIIDAPPVFSADTKILASKVDGVILVVKAWETQKEAIRSAIRQLEQVEASIVGVIINSVPTEFSYYYDSYHFLRDEYEQQGLAEKKSAWYSVLLHLFSKKNGKKKIEKASEID